MREEHALPLRGHRDHIFLLPEYQTLSDMPKPGRLWSDLPKPTRMHDKMAYLQACQDLFSDIETSETRVQRVPVITPPTSTESTTPCLERVDWNWITVGSGCQANCLACGSSVGEGGTGRAVVPFSKLYCLECAECSRQPG